MRRMLSMPSITCFSGPGWARTKILLASAMAAAGKLTWCSTVVSSLPLNTVFCSRPLGTTSISRTTISARVAPDLGFGDGSRRETDLVLHGGFEPPVEHGVLLAPIGHHFDLAHHDIGSVAARHVCGQCQFEFADAFRLQSELRAVHASRIHREALVRNILHQTEPVFGFQDRK